MQEIHTFLDSPLLLSFKVIFLIEIYREHKHILHKVSLLVADGREMDNPKVIHRHVKARQKISEENYC